MYASRPFHVFPLLPAPRRDLLHTCQIITLVHNSLTRLYRHVNVWFDHKEAVSGILHIPEVHAGATMHQTLRTGFPTLTRPMTKTPTD